MSKKVVDRLGVINVVSRTPRGRGLVGHLQGRAGGLPHIVAMVLVALVLTACGAGEPVGNSESTSMSGQANTATPSAATTDQGNGEESASIDDDSVAELTLGELVDRINAQWIELDAFREVSASTTAPGPSPVASPMAASPTSERSQRTVREVILPDRVRYTAELNGRLDYELIVIGERVFARGSVASLLDPTAGPDEWVETDIATVANTPLLGQAAAQQLAELAAPRYAVPDRLRPQPVRPLDPVSVNGAECAAFGAADTTSSGARTDLTFAVAADGRLCFVETEAVGISSRYTVEALDEAFTISAPPGARAIATPVASPSIGATPVGIATPVATP